MPSISRVRSSSGSVDANVADASAEYLAQGVVAPIAQAYGWIQVGNVDSIEDQLTVSLSPGVIVFAASSRYDIGGKSISFKPKDAIDENGSNIIQVCYDSETKTLTTCTVTNRPSACIALVTINFSSVPLVFNSISPAIPGADLECGGTFVNEVAEEVRSAPSFMQSELLQITEDESGYHVAIGGQVNLIRTGGYIQSSQTNGVNVDGIDSSDPSRIKALVIDVTDGSLKAESAPIATNDNLKFPLSLMRCPYNDTRELETLHPKDYHQLFPGYDVRFRHDTFANVYHVERFIGMVPANANEPGSWINFNTADNRLEVNGMYYMFLEYIGRVEVNPQTVDYGESAVSSNSVAIYWTCDDSDDGSYEINLHAANGALARQWYSDRIVCVFNRHMLTGGYPSISFPGCSQFCIDGIPFDNVGGPGGGAASSGCAYVSPSGSDSFGNGSQSNPYATITRALVDSDDVLVMGGAYFESVRLPSRSGRFSVSAYDKDKKAVIYSPGCVVADDAAAVDGRGGVYRFPMPNDVIMSNANIWLFQDGVEDESTEVPSGERHPLERGLRTRCLDTMIGRCESGSLDAAFAEMGSAYKWYLDTETETMYVSCPVKPSADHPICWSKGNSLFTNCDRSKSLDLTGLVSKYARFDLNGLGRCTVVDCASMNVFGAGAFTYDQSVGSSFVRCEASRCFNGENGDGFNGHSSNTGDKHAKQTTVSLIDCWSHDNNDDGYSDHERSETTIIGGLFEHNKKGGVTPSYGSHCTCYNVHSRNNYCGFNYVGEATDEEGGEGGQMACYGCIAESNTAGGVKSGFNVEGAGNTAILVNCISRGNDIGYRVGTGDAMRAIACISGGDVTSKSGAVEILPAVFLD